MIHFYFPPAPNQFKVALFLEEAGLPYKVVPSDTRKGQHEHVAGLELKSRIQMALKQLSPELREAVILRDLEDMDYKEIAAVLKVPEGTVKSRINRGRGELARILGKTERQVV